ncbi:hypothetical protein COV11_03395 [Candidatus Woesearchaeota archaeon CG10_big_fil_rev_8_21_14_0_10_30_7]|nr:MAG: hypothetical protein COV11_03395 [Candidatus Woesearchaeota archaeon CG10_big_fil_rev_8_21_14_0_10_30_7]
MKKIITILLFLLLILGLFSIIYLFPEQKEYTLLETCVNQNSDMYYFLKALKENDQNLCYDTEQTELCQAIINKDATKCDDDLCKAYILKKAYLCEEKDYFCQAFAGNKQSECLNLIGENQKECIAMTFLDYEAYSRENLIKECNEQLNAPTKTIDLTEEPTAIINS